MSAVVADSMSGDRHNSNVELIAQGLANMVSPLFGGIPATGAIARTATNIRSGARTPVAGMIHALRCWLFCWWLHRWRASFRLAALAAILFVVAYNMGEWREIGTILRLSRQDIAVWAATFSLTVLADLTVAVEVGMMLAALLYIYRVSQTTTVVPVTEEYIEASRPHILQDKQVPPYVTILRIHGPFLFGTTEKLEDATTDLKGYGQVVSCAAAQHDGARWHGLARAGSFGGTFAQIGPHVAIMRRSRSAPAHAAKRRFLASISGVRICASRRSGASNAPNRFMPHSAESVQRWRRIFRAATCEARVH